MSTPKVIAATLASPLTSLAARILATCLFWAEFLNHIQDLPGLHAYVVALGSVLIIVDRMAWLGAGMLAVFTLLTVPLAHHFWDMTGTMAVIERLFSEEHMSVIGGLIAVCVASHAQAQLQAQAQMQPQRNAEPVTAAIRPPRRAAS
jgi:transmembrane protein